MAPKTWITVGSLSSPKISWLVVHRAWFSVPLPQRWQAVMPFLSANCPKPHRSQAVAPAVADTEPASHALHSVVPKVF